MKKMNLISSLVFAGMIGLTSAAQATTIIYSSGHSINTAAATAGGVTLASGNPLSGFNNFDSTALLAAIGDGTTGVYGAYDALVIGENGFSNAAARTAIFNFTNNGGHTVVLGAHGGEAEFLNSVFGLSVSVHAGIFCSYCSEPISRINGTGPASLLGLNGSWFIDNAPDTILYSRNDGGDAAFVMSIGAGTLSWLAWDFCDCSEPEEEQAKWFSVLSQAAITPGGGTVPEPGSVTLLGLGLLGLYLGRRRKLAA